MQWWPGLFFKMIPFCLSIGLCDCSVHFFLEPVFESLGAVTSTGTISIVVDRTRNSNPRLERICLKT